MKELKKKTYMTIFAMLSLAVITVLVFVNVRNYAAEKDRVDRILNTMDERGFGDRPGGPGEPEPEKPDFQNMMVMDYELYTVLIEDGEVTDVYSHGNISEAFDAESIANQIASSEKKDRKYIGNLFFADYSYGYRFDNSVIILNNAEITKGLWEFLLESLLIYVILQAVIVFITKLLTAWITRPAFDAFSRQKEFIADASHELKTPLAVIMASADEMTASEKDEKNLENIRYESERMSKLIAGLLNLSKLEDGVNKANYFEENLSKIIEKTCLSYEGVAFEMGVLIDTDIEEGISFKCNKEEIEQMTATILDNAVRHSYKDTTVKVSAKRMAKGTVDIDIINKGDPIPDDEREKIFERFYRGDRSRSRNDNRYGLGLAIARRIARNHGGDITASSGGGETVFHITIK